MATKIFISNERTWKKITSTYLKRKGKNLTLYLQIYLQLLLKKKNNMISVASCPSAFLGVDYLIAKHFLPLFQSPRLLSTFS